MEARRKRMRSLNGETMGEEGHKIIFLGEEEVRRYIVVGKFFSTMPERGPETSARSSLSIPERKGTSERDN